MLGDKLMDEIGGKLRQTLAGTPVADWDRNIRAVLQSAFAKLDLVTREEFDVQREVLLRTREKLERLEARLAELEKPRSDA